MAEKSYDQPLFIDEYYLTEFSLLNYITLVSIPTDEQPELSFNRPNYYRKDIKY